MSPLDPMTFNQKIEVYEIEYLKGLDQDSEFESLLLLR